MSPKAERKSRRPAKVFGSFSKGLKILDLLMSVEGGCRLKDIAAHTELQPSAAVPYLATLLKAGWCSRDEHTKRFFMASDKKDAILNYTAKSFSKIARAADEEVSGLFERYDENVLLAIRRLNRVVFVNKVESRKMVKIEVNQLPDYPIHATAAGRAMLAFDNPDKIGDYLYGAKYELYTNQTISNRRKLDSELELTRKRGYAFNNCEFEDFIIAVAAPVFYKSTAIASLIMQLPSFRYKKEQCHEIALSVKEAAEKISSKLAKVSDKSMEAFLK